MGTEYLIDTNILIEYIGDLLPEKAHSFVSGIIDKQFAISVINKIEILGHNAALTRNTKDFDKIEGLEVLNPYHI
jgi:predicted nucleic acid-binding protein